MNPDILDVEFPTMNFPLSSSFFPYGCVFAFMRLNELEFNSTISWLDEFYTITCVGPYVASPISYEPLPNMFKMDVLEPYGSEVTSTTTLWFLCSYQSMNSYMVDLRY